MRGSADNIAGRRLAVVIPHAGGVEILKDCLKSLADCSTPFRLLLVDNASGDGSRQLLRRSFPWVEVLPQERNLGFAGGCNAGLRAALADPVCEYAVLLNNDTRQEADWLEHLAAAMDGDPSLGAAQSRLLSIPNPGMLDYSGAAGGLLDLYGFPFALGRILDRLEQDGDNWQTPRELCWASGTACILRVEALHRVGLLDEDFFMHMEEIDLNWRLRLAGWKIASVPASRVYHHSGFSLDARSGFKVYLNHRNSLRMLLKNAAGRTLLRRLPLRILLDLAGALRYLVEGRPAHGLAALRALKDFLLGIGDTLEERRKVQALRSLSDEEVLRTHYPGSIALAALLKGRRRVEQLGWLPREHHPPGTGSSAATALRGADEERRC